MTSFESLGLAEPLLRAIRREGYETPTPIQAQTIPAMLEGRDLLGIAQTGTGKTAAFALPILHRLAAEGGRARPRTCRALVMAPTRELAAQIAESFRTYGRDLRMTVSCIVGGVSYGPQKNDLERGVDVLVATPGRLLDHMATHTVRLDETHHVVLDEADHMLDLGFVRPIRRIVERLPKQRQTSFFSATMPREIEALAADMLRDPVKVEVTPQATTVEKITQRVFLVEADRKRSLLLELLGDVGLARTLVFTRTKHGADKVARYLEQAGIPSAAIHGNKSQSQRTRVLEMFRNGRLRVLVATDIAARGIDIDDITHVVNYELPNVPESYVHRIGRTARAGAEGIAFAFCDDQERSLLRDIERTTRQKLPIEDRRGGPRDKADRMPEREDRPERKGGDGRVQRPPHPARQRPEGERHGDRKRGPAPGKHAPSHRKHGDATDRPREAARPSHQPQVEGGDWVPEVDRPAHRGHVDGVERSGDAGRPAHRPHGAPQQKRNRHRRRRAA